MSYQNINRQKSTKNATSDILFFGYIEIQLYKSITARKPHSVTPSFECVDGASFMANLELKIRNGESKIKKSKNISVF